MSPSLTGGCQCGAIRYALRGAPFNVHLCHCRMCQKAVGGPVAALAPVRMEDFAWTRGSPATFRSSTVAERDFCPACGTPLTYRCLGAARVSVTIGSLDRPAEVAPARQYGVESRLPWMSGAVLDGLPAQRTEDAPVAEGEAAVLSFQHPDHDTPPDWTPPRAAVPPG